MEAEPQYMLIFTTEQGGLFKAATDAAGHVTRFTKEEYGELLDSGELKLHTWEADFRTVRPVFVMLALVVENYDFHLGRSR